MTDSIIIICCYSYFSSLACFILLTLFNYQLFDYCFLSDAVMRIVDHYCWRIRHWSGSPQDQMHGL